MHRPAAPTRMIAKAKMEAPDAKAQSTHICYHAKRKTPPHIPPHPEPRAGQPPNGKCRPQLARCVKQNQPSHGTVPCLRSSDAAVPMHSYAITDAKPPESAHQTTGNVFIDIGRYHHQRYHDRQHRGNQQKYHIRHAEQTRRHNRIDIALLRISSSSSLPLKQYARKAITYEISICHGNRCQYHQQPATIVAR